MVARPPKVQHLENQSFFPSADFIKSVCRSLGDHYQHLAIVINGSGPRRKMYAAQTLDRYRRRFITT